MLKKMVLAAVLATTAAAGAHAATVYGVDENNNLVTFNSANPGTFLTSVKLTGLGQTGSLQGIDFRSANSVLYGLTADRTLVFINLATGVATQVGGPLALTGTTFGFDFNPVADRIRIVSNDNSNYVVNPDTGALTVATPVFYAAGDPNAGREPDVVANAYETGTANQFAIDVANDVLVRQANSAGTLTTVGPVTTPPSDLLGNRTSFDIAGSDAFVQNGRNFYSANLATGQLSLIGRTDESLFGIAIAPVPEPATWGLMIAGFGAVGGTLRRRRATVRFANA